jgi:hypothetical protein
MRRARTGTFSRSVTNPPGSPSPRASPATSMHTSSPRESSDRSGSLRRHGSRCSTPESHPRQNPTTSLLSKRATATNPTGAAIAAQPVAARAKSIRDTPATCMTVHSASASGNPCRVFVPPPKRSTTVKKRPSREPEHAGWALTPASAGAPSHDQHATHRSGARPQWTLTRTPVQAQTSRHSCLRARDLPARSTPATGASGLPRNHLLAPTAGVGSSRPPMARQNANSCKDGVHRGWQLLAWKVLPAGLVRVRPHASRGTRSDHDGRLACATAAPGSDRGVWWPSGPGGVDGSRVARIVLLYSPIACAAHPDIRGHAPTPRGASPLFAASRVPLRRGVDLSGQPRAPQADRARDPMRARIRGSDIQCQ